MKKVLLASLLTIACAMTLTPMLKAQGSGVQMSADEYKVYNAANTLPATTPAEAMTKGQAFEAYLKAYPNSAVKTDVLNQILFAYSQTGDEGKTLGAADALLAVDPNNLRALTFEVYYRKADADKLTDATAKAAALDTVAGYAHKGLNAAKPADTDQKTFDDLKAKTESTFESAIADDDLAKKDFPGAIKDLKTEVDANQAQTQAPSGVLQDMVLLANAYYQSTPPDYLDCAWYATRAAAFAQTYAAQIQPLATFCYKRYHGDATGYEKMQAAVQTNVNPVPACPPPAAGTPPEPASTVISGPGCLTVPPAPKPEDIVAQTIASTPDLATLAISDKEFILQYGKPADADKVFDTVKGKSTQFPAVTVEDGSTVDVLKVAVSDDAVASKTADFVFNMKEPLKEVPASGTKIDIEGVYASYTQSPLLITMSDGAVVTKKPAPKPPVRRRR
jgi:hypothetical protein